MEVIEGAQSDAGENGLGALTIEQLMERFNEPGLSVAVIRDFVIHWAKGYGVADMESGERVDTETSSVVILRNGASKKVTGAASATSLSERAVAQARRLSNSSDLLPAPS